MSLKDRVQKDRYVKIGRYVFDRWVFSTAMVLVFAWLVFVAWSYDFELNGFKCVQNHPGPVLESDLCDNPFYEPVGWRNAERLPPGEYGLNPNGLFKTVFWVPWVLLGVAFLLNLVVHNKEVLSRDRL